MLFDQECPACGDRTLAEFCRTSFLDVDDRRIVKCSHCKLGLLLPQPSFEELSRYYGSGYFRWNKANEDAKSWFFSRTVLGRRPKGAFLDVGCATGFFLEGVRRHSGWEVYGNEFSPQAAEYARTVFNLDVRQGTLGQAGFQDDAFDFIHMNNVLEHETDPLGLLRLAGRLLKPGGELLFVVPNGRVDSQAYADFAKHIRGTVPASRDGHLFFFSPESLRLLVGKAGLRIKAVHGAGIVRGLRALGLLPRTPNWYKGYVPRQRHAAAAVPIAETVHEGKKRSKAYRLFKYNKERLFRVPGFHPYAYDYHLSVTKDR